MKTIPERGLENPCWQARKGKSENGPTCVEGSGIQ